MQTMLSKNSSTLLDHAISKFSPEVFLHPVWLRFSTIELLNSQKIAEDLLNEVKNIQANDPSEACQILLLCAVCQNYAGKSNNAWTTIQDAIALAKHCGLFKEVLWALWGACAISFQQGKNQQAAKHLSDLEAELLLQNEWVLANFVDTIKQPLLSAEIVERNYSTSLHDQSFEDLLILTVDCLQRWGLSIGVYNSNLEIEQKQSRLIQPFFPIQGWRDLWHVFMCIISKKNRFSQNASKPPEINILHTANIGKHPEVSFPKNKPKLIKDQALLTNSEYYLHHTKEEKSSLPLSVSEKKRNRRRVEAHRNKTNDETPLLVVYCLGPFQVYQNEQPIEDWISSKGKTIFKYLLTHRERPVMKDILMDLFWPDADIDSARNNLNVAIYGLRQALRNQNWDFSHVLFQNDSYQFNSKLRFWIDYESFTNHLKTARTLEHSGATVKAMEQFASAIALYQGEYLEEDRYEEWLLPQRQYLQDEYLNTLDHLMQHYYEQKDLINCISMCLKILGGDPCCEEAHRHLMRCYYHQGQSYLALRQYHICCEALKKELGIIPSKSTTELYEMIYKHNGG